MEINSKLPEVGTTIFTKMSALATRHQAINLSQGFPDFDADPDLKSSVISAVENGHNQYAPLYGIPELTGILCDHINDKYSCDYSPEENINVTAGATQAIFGIISALIDKGDEVIVFDPSYDCYKPAITLAGGNYKAISLQAPTFLPDWNKVEDAISDRTRLILVNTPHNPTGSIWREEDWAALEELTQDSNIIVLSDEVYEHITFDQKPHLSVLGREKLRHRALATFSFGKSFHVTGWKTGYIAGSKNLMEEFRKVHQYNIFCVHRPTQHGLANYLTQKPTITDELGAFYQKKRDIFIQEMEKSALSPLACQGTYFQLWDYSRISDLPDTEFAEQLCIKHKVATIPISVFYDHPPEGQRLIRICFAKKETTLREAAKQLMGVEAV